LRKANIPIVWPPGGHCIYLKISEIFPDRPSSDAVGYGLAIELIRQYGIRTIELSYLGGYLNAQNENN
jgi:tryptophanase